MVALTFVPDKNRRPVPVLVSGGMAGQLKIWDMSDEETANASVPRSVKAHEGGMTALAISPDGLLIATGGADNYIRLWYRPTGQMLSEVKAHGAAVSSLQFTRDGATLVSGGADRLVRIWHVGAQGQLLDYTSTILAHESAVTAIAISPDASTIASVSTDGYLKLWDMNGGSLLKRIHVSNRAVLAVAFAPDGKDYRHGRSGR